jgi:hypothetical protein
MEHHSEEVHPHFSKEDLAMGAVDLYEEYVESSSVSPHISNSSILEKATILVKEAGPKIVEVLLDNLTPVVSNPSRSVEAFISKPVETVIILPPDHNITTFISKPVPQVRIHQCFLL